MLPSLNTRTWLLLTVIPTLGIITVVVGIFLSLRLYDIILQSIERKLVASSTSTATLIRGEDHEWLVRFYTISAMVYHPEQDLLYGLDSGHRLLLGINPTNGHIEAYREDLPDGLRGLTLAPDGRHLLSLRGNPSELILIDPATGTTSTSRTLEVKATALDWDHSRNSLILSLPQANGSASLMEMSWPEGHLTETGLRFAEEPLTMIRTGTWADSIIGLAADRRHLLFPGSDGEEPPPPLPLSLIEDEEIQEEFSYYPENAAWPSSLVYDSLRQRLLGSGLLIFLIDPREGVIDPTDFTLVHGKEGHPMHLFFNYGLKRVIEELGLTYIYSLAHIEEVDFLYGVDATIDHPDYSPLLTVDAFPESELKGVQRVIDRQDIHVSEIIEWDIWGLVKTAYAPILDSAENTVGVMGADVNIDIIKEKTRAALAGVVLTGLAALFIGILSAFQISRQIVLPLNTIKNSALKIAAGAHEERIEIRRPRELHQLAESFNQINRDFQMRAAELRASARQDRDHRDLIELTRHLGFCYNPVDKSPREAFRYRSGKTYSYEISGALRMETMTVIWLGNSPAQPLQATSLRARIETLLPILAPTHQASPESFLNLLTNLFRESITTWFLLDAESHLYFSSTAPSRRVFQLNRNGQWTTQELLGEGILPLHQALLLASHDLVLDRLPALPPHSAENARSQLAAIIEHLPPSSKDIFFGLLLPPPFIQ